MKKIISILVVLALVFSCVSLVGCSEVDENYGVESEEEQGNDTTSKFEIPEIKSSDKVMPTYLDISLYDEENYSNVCLGSKYEYRITYSGTNLSLPTDYKTFIKEGWDFANPEKYDEKTLVLAGESLEVTFVNEYDNVIDVVFYNSGKSSSAIKKCDIVKFVIKENYLNIEDSKYGQFWVNGVGNGSAITDVIERLGSPSHFLAVSENEYHLDYFISKDDKRSGIMVNIDPLNDTVNSIEISYY